MFIHIPQSTFLSKFSLERSVKQISYKGVDNTSERDGRRVAVAGGSSGMGSGYIGKRGTNAHLSATTAFRICQEGDNKFIESEFMEALASQIKKEIQESRAIIAGSGSPTSNEFYVEYKDGNINGRITISGSQQGEYYVLNANVDESSPQKQSA